MWGVGGNVERAILDMIIEVIRERFDAVEHQSVDFVDDLHALEFFAVLVAEDHKSVDV